MRPIDGNGKSVRQLLGVKYSIDYYQREYRWEAKQVRELLDDLGGTFLEEYEPAKTSREQVAEFPHYFLGSIIISQKGSDKFIVDGQQRLTSLTLLLILLRNLQSDPEGRGNLDALICSTQYGKKTFNLAINERERCMEALFAGESFDTSDQTESVQNLFARYQDMESHFPAELREEALPYFTDWLIDNVDLVEISAYSDEDAYMIFETMNDRGLSLSPTDMLKGYLLANMDQNRRSHANGLWRGRVQELDTHGEDHGADFFKAWLRSQHAESIRERHRGAVPRDFDRIGTEFHRWLRDRRETLGLATSEDFFDLVRRDFDFYSKQYLLVKRAQTELMDGLEHIYYNASHGFTLQDVLLLAPLRPEDDHAAVKLKLRLVARYVDILIARRIWNYRSIAYSTMQYAIFLAVRDIRGLGPQPLAKALHTRLLDEDETFASNDRLGMHQQNRYQIHRILARMTEHVETQSGQHARYPEYIAGGKSRYEVEHIWANHAERHEDEFPHPADFTDQRNRIGGLLLLPKSFNASYGDLTYEEKLPQYNTQNLLARSLHPQAYEHNPGLDRFVRESGLPLRAHEEFKRADMDLRGELYRHIAERIWNPDDLLHEVEALEPAAQITG